MTGPPTRRLRPSDFALPFTCLLVCAVALSGCLLVGGDTPPWESDDDDAVDDCVADRDRDGSDVCEDCDDADPERYPGNPESCDGVDNDCDGTVPEFELDRDGDGFAACDGDCDENEAAAWPGAPLVCDHLVDNDCDGVGDANEVDDDGDGQSECDDDCDDLDPDNFTGNAEVCDGADNDCDGLPGDDEVDDDGDGQTECDGDCDDGDSTNFAGNDEVCDGADNDCDSLLGNIELDDDGDGQTECDGDCDDAEPDAFAGGAEVCDDVDNDCDGLLDVGASEAVPGGGAGASIPPVGTSGTTEVTAFVPFGAAVVDVDVFVDITHTWVGDLTLTLISPSGTEVLLASGVGGSGDDFTSTVFDDAALVPIVDGTAPFTGVFGPQGPLSVVAGEAGGGLWTLRIVDGFGGDSGVLNAWELALVFDGGLDSDGDGVTSCLDCDDAVAATFPGAPELCDELDNDCDGFLIPDEADLDDDGVTVCDGDCDDTDASAWPGAPLLCDGVLDNNCDGTTDYNQADADADGSTVCDGDCDDGDPTVDALDIDADGQTTCDGDCDDFDASLDGLDGDGDGVTSCAGDCDDSDGLNFPGNAETCDGQDNDCDGGADLDVVTSISGGGAGTVVGSVAPVVEVAAFVPFDGLIVDVDVDLDLSHTWLGDLVIHLTSPDGTTVELVSAVGGSGDDFTATVFDDEAPTAIGDGTPPYTGSFQPEESLAAFDGGSSGGLWVLTLQDIFVSADDGTLNSWSVTLTFDSDGDDDGDGVGDCDDCNDAAAGAWPGAPDICDGVVDNDCDGEPDSAEADADGDGVDLCGGDCDDFDGANFPGNAEVCDGQDNDCDGSMLWPDLEEDFDSDGDMPCSGDCDDFDATVESLDLDGDSWTTCAGDCDDTDDTLTPADDDGDGASTCDSPADCDDASASANVLDEDGDGYTTCDSPPDCDDANTALNAQDSDGDGLSSCDGDCDEPSPPNSSVLIPSVGVCAGTFDMGCTAGQTSCSSDEYPVHEVTLTHGFWLGEAEVTRDEWESQMGSSPVSSSCGGDCPVSYVNWYEALAFANAASAAEGLDECYLLSGCSGTPGNDMECTGVSVTSASGSVYDCEGYRLPTEAEWEYAARAGTDLLYSGSNTAADVSWYGTNSGSSTQPIAQLLPNAWGLFDMSGNVIEWVWDLYDAGYYATGSPSMIDPEGPAAGSLRSFRGGSWAYSDIGTRIGNRHPRGAGNRYADLGLRLARTVP